MRDTNIWLGTGRLGHDPELRYTPKEMAVTTFSIAVDRGQDAEKNDKGTDWIDCIAYGKTAEAVKRVVAKGNWVQITGPITVSTYEKTDEDGNVIKKRSVKITVKDWLLLRGNEKKAEEQITGVSKADEDIPF